MKLIVKEHINKIAKPTIKKYTVSIDAVNNYNKIPRSIFAVKGDLIVGRGAGDPVRFPVGANGKALIADSSTPTGLAWGDVASGGGGATVEIYNQTGATINAGTVVCAVPYIGLDDFVGLEMYKAQKYSAGPYYVLSDDCANNSTVQCYCVPDTVCPVLCDTNAVSQGDLLAVSANGQCHSLTSVLGPDGHPLGRPTVGLALEDKASGSVGTVKVKLVASPTIEGSSQSGSSTTYGTCFMAVESEDNTLKVAPVTKGKIPFGVQANKETSAGAVVLLHTKQDLEVAVMADTTEIQVGDWLVPSASANGQVRNGSGHGIGEALTAKASGSAGLVKVHLNLKYGYSPRAWWLPGGITEDQVIAAWQFIQMPSEADALININNGTEYELTKSNVNITWNSESGIYIPGTQGVGIANTSIYNSATDIYSAAFGFSGADTGETNSTVGGLDLSRFRGMLIRGTWNNKPYHNAPVINQSDTSAAISKAGAKYAEGVLSGNWETTSKLFLDGTELAISATGGGYGADTYLSKCVIGQHSESSMNPKPFYVTAVVLYNTTLTASQHLELSNNIKALGGAGA